jgi:hypothetical protein
VGIDHPYTEAMLRADVNQSFPSWSVEEKEHFIQNFLADRNAADRRNIPEGVNRDQYRIGVHDYLVDAGPG